MRGKDILHFYWNGYAEAPWILFKPGEYKIGLFCRGDKCDNVGPIIRFKVLSYEPVSYFKRKVLINREIKNLKWEWVEFPLKVDKEEKLLLKFSFINDRVNPKTREDRNFYLKQLKMVMSKVLW